MIEDAAYATTTYDRLPRVRLKRRPGLGVCFDADCGTVFARRVEQPEGPPQDACLVFEPGWIYREASGVVAQTKEGMSARQLESMLRATARMRELSSSHKRRDRHGPWQGFVVLSEAFQR